MPIDYLPKLYQTHFNFVYLNMTSQHIKRKDKFHLVEWTYIFIILFVLLALFLYLIKILEYKNEDATVLIWSILTSFPIVIILTFTNYYVVALIGKKQIFANNTMLRYIIECFYAIGISALFVSISNILLKSPNESISEILHSKTFEASFIIAILINIISITLLEFIYQSKRSRQKEVEYERLQKENLAIQYEVLKAQINPHFLFNSFNILNSLINKNTSRASDFIHDLSDIYRYILTYNTSNLVSVREETDFLTKYINILTIRFDRGLKIVIDINEQDLQKQIIPMSTQLLLENAVKHNKISDEEPLTIDIRCDGENIIVTNNINKRTVVDSTSIGLHNLKEKYILLNLPPIEVCSTSKQFIVKIPLT